RWKCLEPTAEAARAPGPTAEAARAPGPTAEAARAPGPTAEAARALEPTAEAARSLVPAMHARPPLTQAGKQVVFGHRRFDGGLDQLVIFRRPGFGLNLPRHGKPVAIGVDLGGVCAQRLIAHVEIVITP